MTSIDGPDFITLLVRDLERSHKFYSDQIGLPESSEKQPNAYAFHTHPCGLAIRESPDQPQIDQNPSRGIIIWLHTSDATALLAEFRERAVPIVEELRKSPFGMTFSFKDPDGYVLAVHDDG